MQTQVFGQLADDLARVDRVVTEAVDVAEERLREPCSRLARHAGKMFRSSLVLTSAYLFAPEEPASDRVVQGAALVELLHMATLYHDDVCDHGQTRRGQPTVNVTYGDAVALLCGDYLLACCTQLAAELGSPVMRLFGETLSALSRGQLLETTQAYDVRRTEDDYRRAVSGKTAQLMAASSSLGAILSDRDARECAAVAGYGHDLGVAFQIWDDVTDIWPTRDTGKTRFSDLMNGVYNLPVIYGLQSHLDELHAHLADTPLEPARCQQIADLLEGWGARARAEEAAGACVQASLSALQSLEPPARRSALRLVEVARVGLPEAAPLLAMALPPVEQAG